VTIRNKLVFYGEKLLAPRPTPKLEDHLLSAVRYYLFHKSKTGGRLLHPQREDKGPTLHVSRQN
jgi:hypothetical protein